jgi:hypothetical protein
MEWRDPECLFVKVEISRAESRQGQSQFSVSSNFQGPDNSTLTNRDRR